ncbi:hypothetical protein [Streptomyces sp. NPDC001759]
MQPPKTLFLRGRAQLDSVDGTPEEHLQMNAGYEMPPSKHVEWEAEVRSLHDGMLSIDVPATWATLLGFETTLPIAVERTLRIAMPAQAATSASGRSAGPRGRRPSRTN